jgi:endonuclease YncB( thermonuclease family)
VNLARRRALFAIVVALGAIAAPAATPSSNATYRVDRVIDGDTIALRNGERIRLMQIDAPEAYFDAECYGRQALATTRLLLPRGTRVRLTSDPALDSVDDNGRLLRYAIRVRDGLNVNLRLVAVGAAAPYFFEGRRGRYAKRLEYLATRAWVGSLGLWGACPNAQYDPKRPLETGG